MRTSKPPELINANKLGYELRKIVLCEARHQRSWPWSLCSRMLAWIIENPDRRLGRWRKSCAASVVKHRSFGSADWSKYKGEGSWKHLPRTATVTAAEQWKEQWPHGIWFLRMQFRMGLVCLWTNRPLSDRNVIRLGLTR